MDYALLMSKQLELMNSIFNVAQSEAREMTEDEQTKYNAAKNEYIRLQKEKEISDSLKKMKDDIPTDSVPIPEPADNSSSVSNKHSRVDGGKNRISDKAFDSLGDMLVCVVKAKNIKDVSSLERLQNYQTTEVGSDGGYIIPGNFMTNLMEKIDSESEIASRASQLNLSQGNSISIPGVDETSRADGSRFGGIQVYWVREGNSGTYKQMKFRNFEMKLAKVLGFVKLTEEMLEDGPLIESYLDMAFPAEMAFNRDQAFYNGDGNGMPLGYMNSGALISVNRTTADTVKYEDIVNMWARMPARRMKSAVWFCTQEVLTKLPFLSVTVGTGGSAVYVPSNGAAEAPFGTLHGRPVIPVEQCAALGTKGDLSFVDMNDYLSITKGGIKKEQSIHVNFDTDEVALRFKQRINGAPYTKSKLQSKAKSTFYTSPYITLDVPA